MIEVYKMLNGFERVTIDSVFKLDTQSGIREHKLKLKGNRFKIDIGKYWFINRIVDPWNKLPASITENNSTNASKNRLDKLSWQLGNIMSKRHVEVPYS